jgi:hypothetical protein
MNKEKMRHSLKSKYKDTVTQSRLSREKTKKELIKLDYEIKNLKEPNWKKPAILLGVIGPLAVVIITYFINKDYIKQEIALREMQLTLGDNLLKLKNVQLDIKKKEVGERIDSIKNYYLGYLEDISTKVDSITKYYNDSILTINNDIGKLQNQKHLAEEKLNQLDSTYERTILISQMKKYKLHLENCLTKDTIDFRAAYNFINSKNFRFNSLDKYFQNPEWISNNYEPLEDQHKKVSRYILGCIYYNAYYKNKKIGYLNIDEVESINYLTKLYKEYVIEDNIKETYERYLARGENPYVENFYNKFRNVIKVKKGGDNITVPLCTQFPESYSLGHYTINTDTSFYTPDTTYYFKLCFPKIDSIIISNKLYTYDGYIDAKYELLGTMPNLEYINYDP